MNRNQNQQKRIAVINDFSGFGRCSIAVSLPIISAMKIQCCPMPTAIFSNHTGFSHFYMTDYTEHMEAYADEWKKMDLHFQGIATGFLGCEKQIEIVAQFIRSFKQEDTIVVIDPVMGDYGKLYRTYSPALAARMRELVQYADILTPNLTEACILTGREYQEDMDASGMEEMCAELSEEGPKKVVVSGLDYDDHLGNYVYERDGGGKLLSCPKVGKCRSGTGDVFSSIIVADAVNGVDFERSVERAALFIAKTLKRTMELGIPATDGICFEEYLTELACFQ